MPIRPTGARPMTARCPWCSAVLKKRATECSSCGANLVSDGEPNVPGVTAIDAASIVRSKTRPSSRNRLLSWISGEYPEVPSKAEAQAVAPPDLDVRREMLRLELEAEVANLQAEAGALMAEAKAEGRAMPNEALVAGGPSAGLAEGAEGETAEAAEGTAPVEPAAPAAEGERPA